jgi:hypothetical protein
MKTALRLTAFVRKVIEKEKINVRDPSRSEFDRPKRGSKDCLSGASLSAEGVCEHRKS